MVDHWHGITLFGAVNCRIVNNTVIDRAAGPPGPPWICIGDHKNGTRSTGCTVRNNLVADLTIADGMVVDHNLIVTDAGLVFRNAQEQDLALRPGSPAVDAGTPELAPERDILGVPRPQGNGVDLGAYELKAD